MTFAFLGRLTFVFAPAVLGVVLVYIGFFLSPLWPAQDMPPELAARYARDFELSEPILKAGFAIGFFGLVWMVVAVFLMWRHGSIRGPSKT
jgi:hypothetical protein